MVLCFWGRRSGLKMSCKGRSQIERVDLKEKRTYSVNEICGLINDRRFSRK